MFKRENKNLLNTLRNRYVLEINEAINNCVEMWRKATTYVNIIIVEAKTEVSGLQKTLPIKFQSGPR